MKKYINTDEANKLFTFILGERSNGKCAVEKQLLKQAKIIKDLKWTLNKMYDGVAKALCDTDIKESTTGGLFSYDQATFSQFRRGADFLKDLNANEVKIQLQGDKAREYCNIFRNCYPLAENSFGTTLDIYKGRNTQWHGGGEQQGNTIVDGTARRKDQRLGF